MHSKTFNFGFPHILFAFVLVCFSLNFTGCSQGNPAGDSDSNGYVCNKCGTKFYTSRSVFAEFCPNCKSFDLAQTVAYLCEKDQHVTMSTKTHGGEVCEKCQAHVAAV